MVHSIMFSRAFAMHGHRAAEISDPKMEASPSEASVLKKSIILSRLISKICSLSGSVPIDEICLFAKSPLVPVS